MESYHDILGLKKGASKDEIKKAYKELVKQYHPDVNKSSNANSMFRLINDAYEHLINDDIEHDETSTKNDNTSSSYSTYQNENHKYNNSHYEKQRYNYYRYYNEYTAYKPTHKKRSKFETFLYYLKYYGLKALACISLLFLGIIYTAVFVATLLGGALGYFVAGFTLLIFIMAFIMSLINPKGWMTVLHIFLFATALALICVIALAINLAIVEAIRRLWEFITY